VNSLFKKAVLSDSDLDDSEPANDDNDVTIVDNPASKSPPVTLELLYKEIKKTNDVAKKVEKHDVELTTVRSDMSAGFRSTDFAIAKIYEDQDFASNVLKENRVTIGSLRLDDVTLPTDRSSWIAFMTTKVSAMIKDLFKDEDPLVPVLVGVAIRSTRLNVKKEFPNFDAIFQNSAQSLAFRRVITQSSRQQSLKSVFVSNSVTLATRVRIEVMLILSRYLNQKGFACHVQSFISRPVLHVKTQASPVSKVYTYVDCVREFLPMFENLDLTSAYRRAGQYFDGTLSRFFIVLSDKNSQTVRQQTRNKRPHPSDSQMTGKRKR